MAAPYDASARKPHRYGLQEGTKMRFNYPEVRQITADLRGLFRIDHDAYHSGIGYSSSALKRALHSYGKFALGETGDSRSLVFGRAFHAALLEPNDFARKYAVKPEFGGHPSSNAYKSEKNAWLSANEGKEVISKEEAFAIERMIESVKRHVDYGKHSVLGTEIMAVAPCSETGLLLKCKVDMLSSAIMDFKTTSYGVAEHEFMSDIMRWKYHLSAAFYQDVFYAATGERLPFIIVAVLKDAPYECEFYRLSDAFLEEGRKLYKAGLKRIKRWLSQPAEACFLDGKRTRDLHPSPKVLYSTQEILKFIEGV